MSVTNAISSVIIVGAIISASSLSSGVSFELSNMFGFVAIVSCCYKYIWWLFGNTKNVANVQKKEKKKVK